ncbi:hypothetical protein [Candidatus Ventrimonas sp.]|uniref:hypothetical protein n=1 Tax=Candidatus Ventrimonas sp. TaxID=3048889 RepID=UPI003AB5F3DC
MVLNATEWVENHIGVDIQKEIVITYKFAAFKGADQLFRISSVGRMCQIEYETAGRNVVNTQTVYAGEDLDIMVTEIDREYYLCGIEEYWKMLNEQKEVYLS